MVLRKKKKKKNNNNNQAIYHNKSGHFSKNPILTNWCSFSERPPVTLTIVVVKV
jgi:hypothetical protein